MNKGIIVDKIDIEGYMMCSESKAVRILLWLLKNRDKENVVHTTLDSVAVQCKVTKVTVNRVFQNLYKNGFMVKTRNGEYQLKKV